MERVRIKYHGLIIEDCGKKGDTANGTLPSIVTANSACQHGVLVISYRDIKGWFVVYGWNAMWEFEWLNLVCFLQNDSERIGLKERLGMILHKAKNSTTYKPEYLYKNKVLFIAPMTNKCG